MNDLKNFYPEVYSLPSLAEKFRAFTAQAAELNDALDAIDKEVAARNAEASFERLLMAPLTPQR